MEIERWEMISILVLIFLLILGLGLMKCRIEVKRGVRHSKTPLEETISKGVERGNRPLQKDVRSIQTDVKNIQTDVKNIRRLIIARPVATPMAASGPTTEKIKTETVVEGIGLIVPPPEGIEISKVSKVQIGGEVIKPSEIKKIYLTGRKGTYRIYLITGEVAEVDYKISPGEYLVKIAGEEEK